MSDLLETFNECYLVHYTLSPRKEIEPLKAYPLHELTNEFGGKFLGAKGSGMYGIRFTAGATHVGLFDLSDPEHPILVASTPYDDLAPKQQTYFKVRGCFMIIRRGDKNYKFVISQYKTKREQRKLNAPPRKMDPHTNKVNKTLKAYKYKKES